MTVTIRTQSGSVYVFNKRDGKTYVTRNYLEEGVLAEPVGIELGKPLIIKAKMLNSFTLRQSDDVSFWKSTPAKHIVID